MQNACAREDGEMMCMMSRARAQVLSKEFESQTDAGKGGARPLGDILQITEDQMDAYRQCGNTDADADARRCSLASASASASASISISISISINQHKHQHQHQSA
eukprot:1696463-Rhodomonas_salina.1